MSGYIPVPEEVLDERRRLAEQVQAALRTAGMPVHVVPGSDCAAGAEVEVDNGDADAGGVFVSWEVDPRLSQVAGEHLIEGRTGSPLMQYYGAIGRHMRAALLEILRSGGFEAEPTWDDDMRPLSIVVLGGIVLDLPA